MEIHHYGRYEPEHHLFLKLDKAQLGVENRRYKVDRGISDIFQRLYLPFDFYSHLDEKIQTNTTKPVRVFESGCGIGKTLIDLKKGVTVTPDIIDHHSRQPKEVANWKKSLIGRTYKGLGDAIYTAGITLSSHHADIAQKADIAYKANHITVGPLETYMPNDFFDFVYDFMGPARYFPEEAIPKFGQILKPGGTAFMRLDISDKSMFSAYHQLFQQNQLAILNEGLPLLNKNKDVIFTPAFLDVLVKKTS